MQTTYRGNIIGVSAVTVRPITLEGTYPVPALPAKTLYGVTDIPLEMVVEDGERVVDKADGVGVIAVHEEDDTIVGVDLKLKMNELDINLLEMLIGNGSTNDSVWSTPTIDQQRRDPKRFELMVYAEVQPGVFLRHVFPYCRAQMKAIPYLTGSVSTPQIDIKARPNPTNQKVHDVDYVYEKPIQ